MSGREGYLARRGLASGGEVEKKGLGRSGAFDGACDPHGPRPLGGDLGLARGRQGGSGGQGYVTAGSCAEGYRRGAGGGGRRLIGGAGGRGESRAQFARVIRPASLDPNLKTALQSKEWLVASTISEKDRRSIR